MKKECEILANSYMKLFYQTMNPVFFTFASYIANNKTMLLLGEQTKQDDKTKEELTL